LKKRNKYFFLVILFFILLSSCKITKRVPEKQFLLRSNTILTDNKNINKGDLNSLIKQQPNRKILGILRFNLRLYNFADFGKETKIKKWFKNTIGEAPVILDTMMTNNTLFQQKSYLNNKGYFDATVTKEIRYKRRKADVKYIINAGKPYIIKNISYSFEDAVVGAIVLNDTVNSVIKKMSNYNVDAFQNERERLTKMLRNEGFYNFSREFIFFEVDSTIGNHLIDLKLTIKNPLRKSNDPALPTQKINHKRFIINKIFISPQQPASSQNATHVDTTLVRISDNKAKDVYSDYYFIYHSKPRVNPKVITQSVFFKEQNIFTQKDVEQTYKNLSDLKNYRFINIKFSENKDTLQDNLSLGALDCKIDLTRMPVHYYNIETETTNSGGSLGLAANISYQNRNLFKNAEIFSLKLNGALEAQKIFGESSPQEVINKLPFNTVETGAEANIEIPKFLIPISPEKFPKYFKPKTTLKTGLNFQQRPDYTRYVLNASFGYEWKENEFKKHILIPFEVNSIKIHPDSTFIAIINSIKDKQTQLSYNDNLCASLRYSYVFNNQKINKSSDFSYFRGNIETSGNTLWLAGRIFKMKQDEVGIYEIFNIRYSQYVKFDADYRFYNILSKHSSLVYRLAAGIAIPYGNIDIMPFDKSFYVGGANGLRAWKLYEMGPGAYSDTSAAKFYKTGDIHLETNAEYRFDIYKYFKGAMFVDAGNIWLRKNNPEYPDAQFKTDQFYKQIAVGGGIGARFDFSFFIIRIDAAMPLRDPRREPGQRWALNEIKLTKVNYNLGIGYPF